MASTDGNIDTVNSILRYQQGIDFITNIDSSTTADYVYIGKARPASSTASAIWQVKRIATSTGSVTWSGGDSKFDNIWSTRATHTYE